MNTHTTTPECAMKPIDYTILVRWAAAGLLLLGIAFVDVAAVKAQDAPCNSGICLNGIVVDRASSTVNDAASQPLTETVSTYQRTNIPSGQAGFFFSANATEDVIVGTQREMYLTPISDEIGFTAGDASQTIFLDATQSQVNPASGFGLFAADGTGSTGLLRVRWDGADISSDGNPLYTLNKNYSNPDISGDRPFGSLEIHVGAVGTKTIAEVRLYTQISETEQGCTIMYAYNPGLLEINEADYSNTGAFQYVNDDTYLNLVVPADPVLWASGLPTVATCPGTTQFADINKIDAIDLQVFYGIEAPLYNFVFAAAKTGDPTSSNLLDNLGAAFSDPSTFPTTVASVKSACDQEIVRCDLIDDGYEAEVDPLWVKGGTFRIVRRGAGPIGRGFTVVRRNAGETEPQEIGSEPISTSTATTDVVDIVIPRTNFVMTDSEKVVELTYDVEALDLDIYAYEMDVFYNPSVVSAVPVANYKPSARGTDDTWEVYTRVVSPGHIKVAAAGTMPLGQVGELLQLTTTPLAPGNADFRISGFVNDMDEPFVLSAEGGVEVHGSSYGDVDGSNGIRAFDASLILRYAVNLENDINTDLADLDDNGEVNSVDAVYILQFIVGEINCFPIDCPTTSGKGQLGNGTIAFGPPQRTGSQLVVPVYVAESAGGIQAIELAMRELAAGLSYEGVRNVPEGWVMAENKGTDQAKIALAGSTPVTGGPLFDLVFSAAGPQVPETISITSRVNGNPSADQRVAMQELPGDVTLDAIYPNPFQGSARVGFALAEGAAVTIHVVDVLGRRVATVADGYYSAGSHQADIAGEALSAGLYMLQYTVDGESVHTTAIVKF